MGDNGVWLRMGNSTGMGCRIVRRRSRRGVGEAAGGVSGEHASYPHIAEVEGESQLVDELSPDVAGAVGDFMEQNAAQNEAAAEEDS